MSDTNFDRLRPRQPDARDERFHTPSSSTGGTRRLFSDAPDGTPSRGSVALDCSACRQVTPLSVTGFLRSSLPSVHVPGLRNHSSWMRCPACRRRTWVKLRLML